MGNKEAQSEEMRKEKQKAIGRMFTFLGYVDEEFKEIKVSIEVMSKELVEIGIEEYLREAGRELSLEEKDFLVTGVLLGEQIQQLLEERE